MKTRMTNIAFVAAIILMMIGIFFCLPGCQPKPALEPHKLDTINYTSNAPQLQQQVTTQRAAVITQQTNDRTARGLVGSADANVVAVAAEKPDTRLASAHGDLVKAGVTLSANEKAQQNTIDSQAQTIKGLTDHITADDSLLAQAKAEAAGKKAALDQVDVEHAARVKAESFIAEHKNDVWGAWTHRVVKGISWTLIITLSVLALAIGILGSIYGLPKITAPALTIAGDVINWTRVAAYKVATFIWSAVPVVGHYIDEALNELGLHRASGTVTQVVVPTPAPAPVAGATPNPAIIDALRRYGVNA